MASGIGARVPAHCTGVGKAILAYLNTDDLASLYPVENLPTLTTYSISTRGELLADLERTRLRGYAIDDRESSEEVQCIAAAVFGADGNVAAGLSIAVPVARMSPSRLEELAVLVLASARDLSTQLGHHEKVSVGPSHQDGLRSGSPTPAFDARSEARQPLTVQPELVKDAE
jgi:DNA-binding IclR family transcriptional regulator